MVFVNKFQIDQEQKATPHPRISSKIPQECCNMSENASYCMTSCLIECLFTILFKFYLELKFCSHIAYLAVEGSSFPNIYCHIGHTP